MEYITNEVVDVSFNGEDITVSYDNNLTETFTIGKVAYDKMYKEWLKEQPPFISDIYKQVMNNIILSSIHNNQKCITDLNGFFVAENKEDVLKFIKYMRTRDLTQEKLKWNKPFGEVYNKGGENAPEP
jgi:hypothetical protein